MIRYLSILLLLVLSAPVYAQPFLFVKTPRLSYDCETDPNSGARLVRSSSAAASANTTNWNALNDAAHMTSGGVARDLALRPGRFFHDGTLRIGINSAQTQVRAGGSFTGGGGFTSFAQNNQFLTNAGMCTRLINTSTTNTSPVDEYYDGADLLYGGYGWHIGNFELFAFDLANQTAWNDRDSYTKKETGLRIQASGISGPPNGSFLFAGPMAFMGYKDAILIQPKTGLNGQANNTYWQCILADTCETVFHVNDDQSVTHEIYALCPGQNVDRWIYMERGGHIHVHSGEVIFPNQTVAEIGANYHHTHGQLVIDNLKIDNGADGCVLLKLGAYNGQKRAVFITGSVGSGVTLDPEEVVQGVDEENDQIFIRFTGDPTNAALLNGFSTIDANGNALP